MSKHIRMKIIGTFTPFSHVSPSRTTPKLTHTNAELYSEKFPKRYNIKIRTRHNKEGWWLSIYYYGLEGNTHWNEHHLIDGMRTERSALDEVLDMFDYGAYGNSTPLDYSSDEEEDDGDDNEDDEDDEDEEDNDDGDDDEEDEDSSDEDDSDEDEGDNPCYSDDEEDYGHLNNYGNSYHHNDTYGMRGITQRMRQMGW
jgi:hypothetical protein